MQIQRGLGLTSAPLHRRFVGCPCIFFLSTTVITHKADLSPTEEAKQGLVSTHYIKCFILDTKTVPGPFIEHIPKYGGLAHAMCCNLEFPVWKMSSKGKPRERVNSMEALNSNALDGGFNTSCSS